jgi:hypothetical protein
MMLGILRSKLGYNLFDKNLTELDEATAQVLVLYANVGGSTPRRVEILSL